MPTPNPQTVQQLNNILYTYLWDNKPDKINRIQISQDFLNGGLKMINLINFIKALKTSWIRKLVQGGNPVNPLWMKLFELTIFPVYKLVNFGPLWCKSIKSRISNDFWVSVLESWIDVTNACHLVSFNEALQSPLWYNSNLAPYDLYFSNWFRKGIHTVSDVVRSNSIEVKSFQELKLEYSFPKMNLLEYYRVRGLLTNFFNEHKDDIEINHQRPQIPQHIKILFKNKKGTRDMYNALNYSRTNPKMKLKWNRDLNITLNDINWKQVFRICFKTIQDPSTIWLQYRILFRIIGTQELLYLIKTAHSPNCRMCKEYNESILHLFVECRHTRDLWQNFQNMVKNITGLNVPIDKTTIILGYLLNDSNHKSINTVILCVKQYIYKCFIKNHHLNVYNLYKYIQKVYIEQELVSRTEGYFDIFQNHWKMWRPFLDL